MTSFIHLSLFSIFRDVCQPKAMYGHLESLFGSFWHCAGKGLSHCWLILVSQIIFHLFLKKECIGTVWINGKFTLSFGWKIFREINWQYFALALQNRLLSRKGEWIFDIVTLDNWPKTEVVLWKKYFSKRSAFIFCCRSLAKCGTCLLQWRITSKFGISYLFTSLLIDGAVKPSTNNWRTNLFS